MKKKSTERPKWRWVDVGGAEEAQPDGFSKMRSYAKVWFRNGMWWWGIYFEPHHHDAEIPRKKGHGASSDDAKIKGEIAWTQMHSEMKSRSPRGG